MLIYTAYLPTWASYSIAHINRSILSLLYAKYYAVGDGMHEDFALWLNILKDGRKAYGVDEPLLIYRIAKSSKSGNKFKAAKMNWNTYRYIGLNPIEAAYYEGWYMIKNVIKHTNLKISGRGGME